MTRAFVVHGAGGSAPTSRGLDEISLAGETLVADVRDGSVRRYTVTPEDFGVPRAPLEALRGGTAAENAALIRRIFSGKAGPPRDIVVVNAAAALVASGVSENFRDASTRAHAAIANGSAEAKLNALIDFSKI